MEKEKQIEEMIKITDSHNCPKGQCFKFGYSCNRCKIETLVNAGYGNVKEAVKEFAEGLIKNGVYSCKCSTVKEVAERALKDCSKRLSVFTKSFGDGATEEEVYNKMIKIAEKELLEDKK